MQVKMRHATRLAVFMWVINTRNSGQDLNTELLTGITEVMPWTKKPRACMGLWVTKLPQDCRLLQDTTNLILIEMYHTT